MHFLSCLAQFFLELEIFETNFAEKIKTHILCSVFFFLENRTVYEIKWKNTVERVKSQMTIWRMRISCWIPNDANTFKEYVILIAFSLQQMLYESLSLLR